MKNKLWKHYISYEKIKTLILILIMILCVYEMLSYVVNIYSSDQLNEEIKEIYQVNQAKALSEVNSIETKINEEISQRIDLFNELSKINPDIVAWIKIPDTNIDYPVVKGDNNSFYLNHDIKKSASIAGSIFMDYRNLNNSNDINRIIYGHHMKDGSMFKNLTKYKAKDHFLKHPIIELESLEESSIWEIFSIYITDTKFNYIRTDFDDIEEYQDFLYSIKNKSLYDTGISIDRNDHILTLSTCTYEFDNARFVIHAKKVT